MTLRKYDITLVEKNAADFFAILTRIEKNLAESGLHTHAKFIHEVYCLLSEKQYEQFVNYINSVDLWGGSGAVWEVYIEDAESAESFEKNMINLIDLMDQAKILGRGIKPIRRIFKENWKL